MARVTFDVGGHHFTISKNLLIEGPPSRLRDTCSTDGNVIVLDRPLEAFAAILALYQTGELHIPKSCCPGTFLLELEYWDIRPEMLATCCFFKLQRFRSQQDNLTKFKRNMQLEFEASKRKSSILPVFNRARDIVWSIVDFREKTVLSVMYFGVSLFMVLLSVCNLAFSTDPNFRRNMTNCERYEFMEKFNMDGRDLVADMLKADCGNSTFFNNMTNPDMLIGANINTPPPVSHWDPVDYYDYVEIMVESGQVTMKESFIGTTEPCIPIEIKVGNRSKGRNTTDKTINLGCQPMFADPVAIPVPSFDLKRIRIPNFKIPTTAVQIIELVTTVYFNVDIFFRLVSCPSLVRYFMSIVNLADTVALLGAYTNWILVWLRPKEQYEENWLDLLNYLQMLRSFRLFRLVMTFNISKVLVYSVENSIKDGLIMVLVLISGMCTFSTCFYLSEDKVTVKTIPDAWYWSIITMTTVGYGDIAPQTLLGKIVACLCSICGVLVFSLTVPLFVNQFLTLYQYADMKAEEFDDQENGKSGEKLTIKVEEAPMMKKQPE